MTRYAHKDRARQEMLDALCEVVKFSEKLQEACKEQFFDDFNFVDVFFGSIAIKDGDGFKTDRYEYSVRILKDDIKVIEDLKPHVWYERNLFDGNPEGYLIVANCMENGVETCRFLTGHALTDETEHFMYLKRPKEMK